MLLGLDVVFLGQFVRLGGFLIEQLREGEVTGEHFGGVRILAPDAFLEIDGAEEAAFVLEHGADGRVVAEAGGDGGAIDEPGALELADVGVGLADDEDLLEGDFQLRIALAQDLEQIHDLAGVVELRAGVNPQQHAGQFALVVARVVLVDGGQMFQGGGEIAVVEIALAEGVVFAVVHLVGVGRFLAGGQDGEFGHRADAHEGGVAEFADDRGQHAELARRVAGEFEADRRQPAVEEERDGRVGHFLAGHPDSDPRRGCFRPGGCRAARRFRGRSGGRLRDSRGRCGPRRGGAGRFRGS